MALFPRPYNGLSDLERMKAVIIAGRAVTPHSGYPHIGELDWWLFFGVRVRKRDPAEVITLWENEHGEVVGWIFAEDCGFDMALLPAYRGGAL